MAEDWLADVRRYAPDADENVVAAIVRHCGIALQSRDASLVSFTDPAETDRVRESFLKKKLGLTLDDAVLDSAIAAVGERMKDDRTKNRVTVYYLLTEHFDLFDLFGGAKRAAAGLAAGAAGIAGMAAAAAAAPAAAAPVEPVAPLGLVGAGGAGTAEKAKPAERGDDGFFATGCITALVVFGAVIIAAIVALWADQPTPEAAPPPAPAATVAAPAAPAIPEGAGVIASTQAEKPMLTVYFDVGKADLHPDFAAAAGPMMAYLEANPGATVRISGYNDPTGNAALNAELSKDRAQSVQAGLIDLGLVEARTDLVKPDETTRTDVTAEEARRVEVTIAE